MSGSTVLMDEFETFVAGTLGAEPPAGDLRRIDERVRMALERPSRRSPFAIAVGRLVVAIAALGILAGATVSILSLYGWFGGDAYQYAWNHATRLGVSQVHDGYRVTLEAAYADSAQLMLAITAIDTEDRGWSGIEAASADVLLVGADGPSYVMTGGGSTPASMGSANTVWLDAVTPPAPGDHSFVVTVPAIRYRDAVVSGSADPWHEVVGPWSFSVELPVVGGEVFVLNATATVNGVSATAASLSAAPTRVDIDVRWSDRGPSASSWGSVGQAFHDGKEIPIGGTVTTLGVERLHLVSGTSDPSGHWKVVIDEIIGTAPDGTFIRISGPWIIEFDIP